MRINYIILLSIILISTSLKAQLLDKQISINTENIEISKVLLIIGHKYNIDFSYSNTVLSEDKKVNLHLTNKKLKFVLDELFKTTDISYKEINQQIILYVKSNKTYSNNNRQTKIVKKIIYDTIRHVQFDTVTTYTTDTLVIIDTIQLYDTIVIERIIEKTASHDKQHPESQFILGITGAIMFPPDKQYSIYSGEDYYNITPKYSYNYGFEFGFKKNRHELTTGIEISKNSDRLKQTIEGIYEDVVDTTISTYLSEYQEIDSFYTIQGNDTTWTEVTYTYSREENDTSYSSHTDTLRAESETRLKRKLTYISIPLSYSFIFFKRPKISIGGTVGLRYSYLLKQQYFNGTTWLTNTDYKYHSFLINAGFNFRYFLNNNLSICLSPKYCFTTTSIYNNKIRSSFRKSSLYTGIKISYFL